MNAKKLFFLAVMVVMGTYGCAFEPDGEFFAEVLPPEPISVTLEIDDPVFRQPYYLIQPTNFHIKLQDVTYPLISSEVAVRGSVISSRIANNRDLFFTLDPNQFPEGNHTVSIRCFLNTKSGSLANLVGVENYVVDQTFNIRIDSTPPVFDSFHSVVENGFLTFKWNNKTNQQNYVYQIKRESHYYLNSPDTLINNPLASQFIDHGYMGGNLYYQIIAKGFGFEKVIGEGTLYHEAADFTASRTAEGQAVLSWTTRKFAGSNPELSIRAPGIFDGEKRVPFTASGEIMLGHSPMGQKMSIGIDFYRRDFINRKNHETAYLDPTPNIKPFTFYGLLNNTKTLLVGTPTMLYRYRMEGSIQLEDSILFDDLGFTSIRDQLDVSPDESRAYICGFGTKGKLISFNPQNFDDIQEHDVGSILTAFDLPVGNGSMFVGNVSNNGLLTLVTGKDWNYTVLIDIPNNKVVWHSPPNNDMHPIVSPDGKFLAAPLKRSFNNYEGWVFEIRDGKTDRIGRMDGGYPVFLSNGTEIMSSVDGKYPSHNPVSQLSVFDLKSPPLSSDEYLPLLRGDATPNVNGVVSAFYDPAGNYIAFSDEYRLRLYNMSTMSFEKSYQGHKLLYSNNYLLSSAGFIELAP